MPCWFMISILIYSIIYCDGGKDGNERVRINADTDTIRDMLKISDVTQHPDGDDHCKRSKSKQLLLTMDIQVANRAYRRGRDPGHTDGVSPAAEEGGCG